MFPEGGLRWSQEPSSGKRERRRGWETRGGGDWSVMRSGVGWQKQMCFWGRGGESWEEMTTSKPQWGELPTKSKGSIVAKTPIPVMRESLKKNRKRKKSVLLRGRAH